MKITKFKEDITSEIASSFKNSISLDTEATGLKIPERDKLSLFKFVMKMEMFTLFNQTKKLTKLQI